jgi:hypothetical protein
MSAIACRTLLVVACFSAACAGRNGPSSDDAAPGTRSQHSYDASPYAFLRAGSVGYDEMDAIWAGLPYRSIRLTRSGCFGSCPAYEVAFTPGSGMDAGSATYEGKAYVEREGSFEGAIDVWDYAHLCELLDHLGFVELDENYSSQWSDDESITVEASDASGLHRVLDYGHQGPPELVAVQFAIEAVTEKIDWQ